MSWHATQVLRSELPAAFCSLRLIIRADRLAGCSPGASVRVNRLAWKKRRCLLCLNANELWQACRWGYVRVLSWILCRWVSSPMPQLRLLRKQQVRKNETSQEKMKQWFIFFWLAGTKYAQSTGECGHRARPETVHRLRLSVDRAERCWNSEKWWFSNKVLLLLTLLVKRSLRSFANMMTDISVYVKRRGAQGY